MARAKHRLDAHDECLDALIDGMQRIVEALRLLDLRVERLEAIADGKHLQVARNVEESTSPTVAPGSPMRI